MYYLQSRYYDPEVSRFLNADAYTSTGQGLLGNNMFAYCGNNPGNMLDASGTAACYAHYSTDRFGEMIVQPGAAGGLGILVTALAGAITVAAIISITDSLAEAKALSKAKVKTQPEPDYTVYFLYAAGGDPNTIVYVGRVKTSNFAARMSYHSAQGREYAYSISGLNYVQCRGVEQAGMVLAHSIKRNNALYNQIRGVSPTNGNSSIYYKAFVELVTKAGYPENSILPASYWANLAENEWLNGLG